MHKFTRVRLWMALALYEACIFYEVLRATILAKGDVNQREAENSHKRLRLNPNTQAYASASLVYVLFAAIMGIGQWNA